jgi:hypothetical protein
LDLKPKNLKNTEDKEDKFSVVLTTPF